MCDIIHNPMDITATFSFSKAISMIGAIHCHSLSYCILILGIVTLHNHQITYIYICYILYKVSCVETDMLSEKRHVDDFKLLTYPDMLLLMM